MDNFDKEVRRIHRRRALPSIIFSQDMLFVCAVIYSIYWFGWS